ncbi:c-type cytochrome [Thiocystis violascens]|uniref:Cytochrome c2 n=1 Tax=Thiocystis violascens (strain ATCC 17096 / DSM 198 / 6111) TaxID=765911 RepID=I3Y7S6_THIV6|nr:c-type cytochrome [Thiocystis violascens]AFL73044.1 cytochrome c2 [Thiocystis violascens DSM 198]
MKPRLLAAFFIGSALLVIAIRAQEGDLINGQRIYAAKMCNLCHTLAGESGPMAELGGPLDGIGTKRDAAWIRLYLKDPMAALPEAKMPRIDLTDQEIADLTAFLRGCRQK